MKQFKIMASALAVATLAAGSALAQAGKVSDEVVRIGVLADMTGIYSDLSGKGAVEAVRMAVEDYGGKVLGKPIEVIQADHQNKPDIGSNIARQWFDTGGVDLLVARELVYKHISLSLPFRFL